MSNKNIDYLTKHYNEFIYPSPIEDIQKDWVNKNMYYVNDPTRYWYRLWPEKLYNKEKLKILLNYEADFSQSIYLSDARMELADTYTSKEQFQEAISPLSKVLGDNKATEFYPLAFYKLGIVYFNLNKNQEALQNFKSLFSWLQRD